MARRWSSCSSSGDRGVQKLQSSRNSLDALHTLRRSVAVAASLAAGAWGTHALIERGRDEPGAGLRALHAAIAEVEAGRRTTPLIGAPSAAGDVTVTFLARGAGGLAPRIVSDVTGWGEHIDGTFDFAAGTMARVGESEWYFLRAEVMPRARVEYQIAYGQTDYRLDPHNRRRSAGPEFGGAPASEFVTPGYQPPQEFEGPPPSPAGTVSESAIDGPCKVLVYAPPGHARSGAYPTAIILDLRSGPASRVLDYLIARGDIPPVVAAFVGPKAFGDERCSGAALAEFVSGPLLAQLGSRYGATGRAESRAILGISFHAKDALDIASRNPNAFGSMGLLIPGRRIGRAHIEAVAGRRGCPLRITILAGRYDHANLPTARGLRQALTGAGHVVNYVEVPEGHTAVTWRNHLREVLVSLLAVERGDGCGAGVPPAQRHGQFALSSFLPRSAAGRLNTATEQPPAASTPSEASRPAHLDEAPGRICVSRQLAVR